MKQPHTVFSHGARSVWPVRALTYLQTYLFIKTQPFHATASYCTHNSGCENSANISEPVALLVCSNRALNVVEFYVGTLIQIHADRMDCI